MSRTCGTTGKSKTSYKKRPQPIWLRSFSCEAVVCPNCGCAVQAPVNQQEDKPSTGLNILAFLFPLVGLILFLCFQKTTPVRAKAIGKWALDGFVVGVALSILVGILGGILGAMYA